MSRFLRIFLLLITLCLSKFVERSWGVILLETGDPDQNTTEPKGLLTGSGWQWLGQWQNFIGTPIDAHYFITAAHIGGTVGLPLVIDGKAHVTTAAFRDPASDLMIWQVREPFENWAPLNELTNEIGQPFVVFGRGTQRGTEVYLPLIPSKLRGWRWGLADGRLRWGQNEVSQFETSRNEGILDVFYATFDQKGGANECHLSVGDSGGPCFIQTGGRWCLVGINYGVDGHFNTSPDGSGFDAALFDRGGLYSGSDGSWIQHPMLLVPRPSGFFATRISVHTAWIRSVLDQPLRLPPQPMIASAADGPYVVMAGAEVNQAQQTITLPTMSTQLFLRLESTQPISIESARIQGTNFVVSYLFLTQ